jgi:hypothetical protein
MACLARYDLFESERPMLLSSGTTVVSGTYKSAAMPVGYLLVKVKTNCSSSTECIKLFVDEKPVFDRATDGRSDLDDASDRDDIGDCGGLFQ